MPEPARASLPGFTGPVRAIGRVTFLEILRDKILYNILVCAALLLGLGLLASRLVFARPERVLLDFGYGGLRVSCAMIGLLVGAAMIGREFERRTAWVALSKPISRLQFVCGKFAGLAALLAVNWALLSAVFAGMVAWSGGEAAPVLTGTFAWALGLALLESLLVACVAVFFSCFSTTSLAVICTLGLYLIGHNISRVLEAVARLRAGWISEALRAGAVLLPNLEHFELGTRLTYSLPVEPAYGLRAIAYAAAWCGLLLLASSRLLRGRES